LGQRGGFADHDERGRRDLMPGNQRGQLVQTAGHQALAVAGAVLDDGDRGAGSTAMANQALAKLGSTAHPHVDGQGMLRGREAAPVQSVHVAARLGSDQRQGPRRAAQGQGQADGRGAAQRGGDPGHDLARDAGGARGGELLATASEHERVAPLEAHDAAAGRGVPDHQGIDLALPHAAAGPLTDRDELRVAAGQLQDLPADEAIVQHDVGLPEALDGLQRQ
jgi:hypothetical protein